MTYLEVPYAPRQVTYSGSFGVSSMRSTTAGQASGIYRRGQRKESGQVNMSWVLDNKFELVIFMLFFKKARTGLPFLHNLYFDNTSGPAEYRCFVVPGTFNLTVNADKVIIAFDVEVLR